MHQIPDAPEVRAAIEKSRAEQAKADEKQRQEDELKKFASIRRPEETAELRKMIEEALAKQRKIIKDIN